MTEGGAIESVFKGPHAWLAAPLREGSPTAGKLATAVGRRALWALCRRLHAEGREPDAFRALFSALWAVDHLRIRADVDRETLNNMMVFGRFANPPGDTVTVWRGGHGVTAEALAAGWSWSTSYRWAAWFAMARSPEEQPGGAPLVVVAEVPPGQCYIVPGRLSELAGEVLLVEPPASVLVAGSPVEWEAEAAKAEATRLVSRPLGLLADAGEVLRWAVSSTGTEGAV